MAPAILLAVTLACVLEGMKVDPKEHLMAAMLVGKKGKTMVEKWEMWAAPKVVL